MRKASEILSDSVELQFPDVDISGAAGTAKLLALTVRFDGSIQTVWEDTLDLIVRARRFREIRHHAGAQVDAHDRGLSSRLVAGERHFVTKLNWSRSAVLAEKPQFVVARAAYADVLEMIGTDQDVVAGHQVNHPQKHSGRHIAGEAAHFAGL